MKQINETNVFGQMWKMNQTTNQTTNIENKRVFLRHSLNLIHSMVA